MLDCLDIAYSIRPKCSFLEFICSSIAFAYLGQTFRFECSVSPIVLLNEPPVNWWSNTLGKCTSAQYAKLSVIWWIKSSIDYNWLK